MFWPKQIAKEIIKSGKYQSYWVDDMKTPSGRVHVGALRGVVIHDLIYKALQEEGEKVTFSYVINDMDPMDGFPTYLNPSFKKYMGWPLFKIPSPKKGYSSFARYYAEQFIGVFNKLGAKPKIIWSSEYYQRGKFNQVIKEALDKVRKIRALYKKISHYDKPKSWYPFQVVCPRCGKVGTTVVTGWDGEKVKFTCQKDLVGWAKGCGYEGEISPFDGNGKLMWKVDWAAHWKVIGITVEWAGKDHMTEGGSYDLSSAICRQVFHYSPPHARLYEWFLTQGGSKMSSSKGVGVSAVEVSNTLPAEILRFLLVKNHYRRAIIFDPYGNETILKLFDDYDAAADSFYRRDRETDWGEIWKFSQVSPPPSQKPFFPRLRTVVNYLQSSSIDMEKEFSKIKGKSLTVEEKKILQERIKYGRIWLKTYAPGEFVYQLSKDMPKEATNLSKNQKKYLQRLALLLQKKDWQPEKLQQELYNLAKKLNIPVKKAFQAIYLSLIGKTHGPKAAWFLLSEGKEKAVKKFQEATS